MKTYFVKFVINRKEVGEDFSYLEFEGVGAIFNSLLEEMRTGLEELTEFEVTAEIGGEPEDVKEDDNQPS